MGASSPVRRWPAGLQIAAVLLLGDLIGYWMHRLFHGPLWRYHAIHHSSKQVDCGATRRGAGPSATAVPSPYVGRDRVGRR